MPPNGLIRVHTFLAEKRIFIRFGKKKNIQSIFREEHLFEVFENRIRIKNECSSTIFFECGLTEITVKQIAYLKAIDESGEVTFSRLAEITRNFKPPFLKIYCFPSPDSTGIPSSPGVALVHFRQDIQ